MYQKEETGALTYTMILVHAVHTNQNIYCPSKSFEGNLSYSYSAQ